MISDYYEPTAEDNGICIDPNCPEHTADEDAADDYPPYDDQRAEIDAWEEATGP